MFTQERLGVFTALTNALSIIGNPRTRLVDDAGSGTSGLDETIS